MDDMDALDVFLEVHQNQLESSGVPKQFWSTLNSKLRSQTFDAGLVFQIASVDYGDSERDATAPLWKLFVAAEDGVCPEDPESIFLIDHAWTYEATSARKNLEELPQLLDRMCDLMGVERSDEKSEKIESVLSEMWRYNQSFALSSGTIEQRMPVWYIMDELGSSINHGDNPNFRTVPFLYRPEGATYTLLFPTRAVESGEEVTRDFVEGQTNDAEKRRALLLPWISSDFSASNFLQTEPPAGYFLSGHLEETLPQLSGPISALKDRKLKVFSEYDIVNRFLTDPGFELVKDEAEADVLWLMRHFKDYEKLSIRSPRVFINQFPFENVFTIKDLLAIVCRRKAGCETTGVDFESMETCPKWLPTTYNLSTELAEFVAFFKGRQAKNLDNHWICKPWNLARGLDTTVTNNLNQILRLPSTGPKIAQKYIEKPVLFDRPEIGRVKFDVRYVVLLKSVEPLRALAYANFFLRFANREFALDNLDNYEQHFTVMNYTDSERLCHIKCQDFVVKWNEMYPDFEWATRVQPKILKMLREVFEAAALAEPPKGVANSPQSRAVYAADLMLQWNKDQDDMEPAILEINFTPDNKRACDYYPDFYNDIFKCLFLDNTDPDVFHDLCPEDLDRDLSR